MLENFHANILKPFTFLVYCRMRSLILGLSVRQTEKEKSQKNREEVSDSKA